MRALLLDAAILLVCGVMAAGLLLLAVEQMPPTQWEIEHGQGR